MTMFLLLTAFANGCTAMTGVEAVSNGVPAFRPPESKNAAATLVAMAVLAISMFLGITFLAHQYLVMPTAAESGISQLGRGIFGDRTIFVLPRTSRHHADPRARGQHRLRRLPAPRVDRVARWLPPAPVHEPGRPPGVLERDHRAVRVRSRAHRGVPRRHTVAAPAVHDRRVHFLHAVASRDGHPLAEDAKRRDGRRAPSSTDSAPS